MSETVTHTVTVNGYVVEVENRVTSRERWDRTVRCSAEEHRGAGDAARLSTFVYVFAPSEKAEMPFVIICPPTQVYTPESARKAAACTIAAADWIEANVGEVVGDTKKGR